MEAEAPGCGGEGGSPRGEGCRAGPAGAVSNGSDTESGQELVELRVIWNKNKYDVKFRLDSTGADLKQKIHSLTGAWGGPQAPSRPPPPDPSSFPSGLPPAMQKVMFKGLLPEEKTLREIKVTNGAKIMVVGSTINDVLAVNTPKDAAQQEGKVEESKKEPLCRQKVPGSRKPLGMGWVGPCAACAVLCAPWLWGGLAGLCGPPGAVSSGSVSCC